MRVAVFDTGVVNLAYAVLEDVDGLRFKITSWGKWQLGNDSTTCAAAVESVVRLLHENAGMFSGVDTVIIERQMVMRMSAIAHAIQATFLCMRHAGSSPADVYMQHGARKNECGAWLRAGGQTPSETGRATYHAYKRRAVHDAQQALSLCTNAAEWTVKFGEHAKKDDLADALLHGLWFMYVSPPTTARMRNFRA